MEAFDSAILVKNRFGRMIMSDVSDVRVGRVFPRGI
jgi:hypothetical protein